MQKVIVIVGPTAVGKTTLSIDIAKKYHGQIISGDSMQVYQNLNIGTAKVTKDEMQGIQHYMINVIGVNQRFSVAEFINNCQQDIKKIYADGELPIIVGGTGFYLQALFDGFELGGDYYDNASNEIRKKWKRYAENNGKVKIWNELNNLDPKAANKIPINNTRRVIRALEVIEKTGKLFSNQKAQGNSEISPLIIGLTTDREILYRRINARVDKMIELGLVEEAKHLYELGGEDLPAGKGIGYKELYPYFRGEISLDKAIELIKRNSRRYAKRQLTWFRNKMSVDWFDLISDPNAKNKIYQTIDRWLEN